MSIRFHRGGWEVRWRDAAARPCRLSDEPAARDNTRDNIHCVQGVQSVQKTPRFAGVGRQQTHLRGVIRVEGLVD